KGSSICEWIWRFASIVSIRIGQAAGLDPIKTAPMEPRVVLDHLLPRWDMIHKALLTMELPDARAVMSGIEWERSQGKFYFERMPRQHASPVSGSGPTERAKESQEIGQPKPSWDEDKRILWLGSAKLKEFRNPARNQIDLIEAFHQAQWPYSVLDP